MSIFKVTQKQGNRTIVSTFEAKNSQILLDFLNQVSTAKVTCIYKVLYEDDTANIPVDDFNYFKQYKAFADNNLRATKQILIHNVKKSLGEETLKNLIKECLEVDGANIQNVKCRLLY